MQHAIKSIFLPPEMKKGEYVVRNDKQKWAVAEKAADESSDPRTDFQQWHRDAVLEYNTRQPERQKKKAKNTSEPPDEALAGTIMSEYLARPRVVEYFDSNDRLNAQVLKDAWARDRMNMPVVTTMGDGRRHQCVVTMNASGVLSASCRVAIAVSLALCMCTPQQWPFPHTPHVACDCFCVGIQMDLRSFRTQRSCRCTRISWTCLLTSWTAVFS